MLMFAGDHATGPPLTLCPPARRWLNARRLAADSSPPARRWLKPAGLALIHARWPPISLAPWIKSTCHGQECRVSVLLCPQEHFKLTMSCHSQPPAPLSLRWKRLLRDPVRAPDTSSCPEEAPASKPAQEGFWFLWDVLSCLSGPGVLSCTVLCV